MSENENPLDDPFADPFALDSMPPEELTFRDWVNITNAIQLLDTASKMDAFPLDIPEGGYADTIRRVKIQTAFKGKQDPMEMIKVLTEVLTQEAERKNAEKNAE